MDEPKATGKEREQTGERPLPPFPEHAFTKSLARNLLDRGIWVNCVAPGPVWTPLNPSDRDAEGVSRFGADVPMGRPAQPEEIAPAYVFFASQADSSYISGEVLVLLGGETIAG